jgi:DNA primase
MDPVLKLRIEQCQREVSLLEVIRREHIRMKPSRDGAQVACPFHGVDIHPSAHVYASSNRFWCFACHRGHTVVGFFMRLKGISLFQSVEMLESQFKLKPVDVPELLKQVSDIGKIKHRQEFPNWLTQIKRELRDSVDFLNQKSFEEAFTAYWMLTEAGKPSEELCQKLLNKLAMVRGM